MICVLMSPVIDADHQTTHCGLWKSTEMVPAKASNPRGTPTLPAAGADVGPTVIETENCSAETTGCPSLSLPDIFFDYSDLDTLKNNLPRLHDRVAAAALSTGTVDESTELRLRGDEITAVLRCFELAGSVITQRIRMCEELFNQETRGHRPVSCFCK